MLKIEALAVGLIIVLELVFLKWSLVLEMKDQGHKFQKTIRGVTLALATIGTIMTAEVISVYFKQIDYLGKLLAVAILASQLTCLFFGVLVPDKNKKKTDV